MRFCDLKYCMYVMAWFSLAAFVCFSSTCRTPKAATGRSSTARGWAGALRRAPLARFSPVTLFSLALMSQRTHAKVQRHTWTYLLTVTYQHYSNWKYTLWFILFEQIQHYCNMQTCNMFPDQNKCSRRVPLSRDTRKLMKGQSKCDWPGLRQDRRMSTERQTQNCYCG